MYLAAVKQGIDPRYIPVMAMIESGGGQVLANSFNPFGRKSIGGGWMAFGSWEYAINNQAIYLRKYYYNEGRTTPESISAKYAPKSDGNAGYSGKLRGEMNKI